MAVVVTGRVDPAEEPGRFQRQARLVLVIALVALGLWIIQGFLPALVWAGILVIALWPSYSRAARAWPAGRSAALPALFTTLVALVFVVPLLIGALRLAHEVREFSHWMSSMEQAGIPVPTWVASLPIGGAQIADWWTHNLATPFDSNDVFRHFSHLNRESMFSVTRQFGVKFVHRAVIFAFTLMTLFFLFRDGAELAAKMLGASHRLFGPRGEHLSRQIVASVHGTVDGLVLVGIGEGVAMGIAYYFASVPHPVLLAAVTAVAAMIPFGAAVAFCGAALYLATQGAVVAGVVIVVLGLVVVGIADHLIRPVLIGGATKLPFVWVLFGILGGVETFGLLGLFLGPAVMSALILLWREYTAPTLVESDDSGSGKQELAPAPVRGSSTL